LSGVLRLGEGGFAGGAALGDATYSEFGGEFVDPLGVEIFAVATAVPFDGFLMVAAPGFGDGVEKGLETGCSADILGRSASLAIDISRIFGGRLAGLHRLDGDDMFPIVSHIVGKSNWRTPRSSRVLSLIFFAANWVPSSQSGSGRPYRLSSASNSQR